jgi:capsid assembly protease
MPDLPHLASRVFGTPLMIARAKLEVILGVLGPRLAGGALEVAHPEHDPAPAVSITGDGIAIVPVTGTLVSRSGYLDAASGLQAYGDIAAAMASAMNDGSVRGVVLDVDSPGGEVGGLFDLVAEIKAIRLASAKPLWAVANESALSAAYAIASTADRLYVTRTGEVGSIGVVAAHVDESGADAKAGLAWTFLFAGERKVDGNAHEPLSERARATIQADIDRLYSEFCALVATNRGMTAEVARSTNAAIYRGELAIRAGLADQLGTLDFAIAEMAAELDRAAATPRIPVSPTAKRSPSMANNVPEQIADQEPTQVAAAPPTPPAPPAPAALAALAALADIHDPPRPDPVPPSAEPRPEAGAAERLRAEFAEVAAVAAQAARLGVTVDAADALRKGIAPDALRRSVLDTLAARAEATSVIAAAPSPAVTGDSPIVRRAKERAAAART